MLFQDVLKITHGLTKKYKGVLKFWFGNDLILYTDNAKDCHKVLKSEDALEKADLLFEQFGKLAKEGLIFSRGKLFAACKLPISCKVVFIF